MYVPHCACMLHVHKTEFTIYIFSGKSTFRAVAPDSNNYSIIIIYLRISHCAHKLAWVWHSYMKIDP